MLRGSQALIRHRFCPYWASWLINFEQSVLVCINEIATLQISSCEWRHILESLIAAMCSEEGGAYASAIGQESREDKLENAKLQNQIGGRSVTLGHHPI